MKKENGTEQIMKTLVGMRFIKQGVIQGKKEPFARNRRIWVHKQKGSEFPEIQILY